MLEKVIAVIVTYNRKELLKESIHAILNQNYKNCDILVIDNFSTDGTAEYIKDVVNNERVSYINTGSNLGGAGGFNFGIKEAIKMNADYIWVMDDDCIVHKDTLEELMKADKQLYGNYGFLSSKVLWKDNSICTMNLQRRTLTKNIKNIDRKTKIKMASFVSFFIKRKIVLELGLPIKDFFIWTDDWEYSRRISRKYNCYFIPNSIVTHKSKNNIGANIANDSPERLDRYRYLYRNDVYLYKREGIKGYIYIFLRIIYHALKIIVSKQKNKRKKLNIIFKTTREGFTFNPNIEYVE